MARLIGRKFPKIVPCYGCLLTIPVEGKSSLVYWMLLRVLLTVPLQRLDIIASGFPFRSTKIKVLTTTSGCLIGREYFSRFFRVISF